MVSRERAVTASLRLATLSITPFIMSIVFIYFYGVASIGLLYLKDLAHLPYFGIRCELV